MCLHVWREDSKKLGSGGDSNAPQLYGEFVQAARVHPPRRMHFFDADT
jgi:hypothetical protein